MPIMFKQLRTLEDLALCERLQEAVWKFNKADIIPSRFMRILCKHGGFATDAEDLMIGFYLELQQSLLKRTNMNSFS